VHNAYGKDASVWRIVPLFVHVKLVIFVDEIRAQAEHIYVHHDICIFAIGGVGSILFPFISLYVRHRRFKKVTTILASLRCDEQMLIGAMSRF